MYLELLKVTTINITTGLYLWKHSQQNDTTRIIITTQNTTSKINQLHHTQRQTPLQLSQDNSFNTTQMLKTRWQHINPAMIMLPVKPTYQSNHDMLGFTHTTLNTTTPFTQNTITLTPTHTHTKHTKQIVNPAWKRSSWIYYKKR